MNEDKNLPETEGVSPTRRYPPALRIQRFAAMLIDSFVMLVLISPFVTPLGLQGYLESGELIPISIIAQLNVAMFAVHVLVNGWWLYLYGQTVGKRILKIAIATNDYQVPSFNRVIFVRYAPFVIAGIFPILKLVNIVDALLIFREDRRCLHDILAGTQVIDVSRSY